MMTRYDAAINGTWLSEIDESILVTDVSEATAKTRTSTAQKAVGAGLRFIRQQRESLSVTVSFVIWEQDVSRRKEILMRVQTWALGVYGGVSYLEVNDRMGQRLYVRNTELPALASAANYQEELRIVFTAYELPFWLDNAYSRVTIADNGSLFIPGMGETVCDAEVANTGSSAITSITLTVGSTSITFAGISLGAGKKLELAHDELGILSAKIGGASVLANRTAESDDELVALCGGYNAVSVSGGSVSAVIKARGVYL